MIFWGSLRVLKILVYFPYTDFRVLQKRRKGANYRRFYRIQNNVRRTVKRREIDEVTRNKKPQDARCTCRT